MLGCKTKYFIEKVFEETKFERQERFFSGYAVDFSFGCVRKELEELMKKSKECDELKMKIKELKKQLCDKKI